MSRPKVLVDRHQADLLFSLQLLFEDRLGMDLYVPVGNEWWDEGYWAFGKHVYGDDRLAQQFLTIDAAYSGTLPILSGRTPPQLPETAVVDVSPAPEMRITYDTHHPERPIRAVTLPQARAAGDWAFVVASVPDNETGFHRFAQEVGAKYVLQVGNTGQQINWDLDPLALVSSEMPIAGRGVRYHQEFDAQGTFGYRPGALADRRRVASFVNCMSSSACWATLLEYEQAFAASHRFLVHGIDGPSGNMANVAGIARAMSAAGWAWQDKHQGDGFGHVIHNWAAIGRPLIGHASHYANRLAEPLWEDGVTCIDLDQRSLAENVALIQEISQDQARHEQMCVAIRRRFEELVDFDAEEQKIRELLGLAITS